MIYYLHRVANAFPSLYRLALLGVSFASLHVWLIGGGGPLYKAFSVFFALGLATANGIIVFGDMEKARQQRHEIALLKVAVKSWRSRPATDRVNLTPPRGTPAVPEHVRQLDLKMAERFDEELPRTRPLNDTFATRRGDYRPESGQFRAPLAMVPYEFLPKMDVHAIGRFTAPPAPVHQGYA